MIKKMSKVSLTSFVACVTLVITGGVASAGEPVASHSGYTRCGVGEHVILNVAVTQSYVHWVIDTNGRWPGGRASNTVLQIDPATNGETATFDTTKRSGTWTVSTTNEDGTPIKALYSAYAYCS